MIARFYIKCVLYCIAFSNKAKCLILQGPIKIQLGPKFP